MSIVSLFLKNKRVLVTGACGTVGSELVRQLLENYGVGELIGIDNNESELFFLEQRYRQQGNAQFLLADIRDRQTVARCLRGIDVLFHAAAYKHVLLCEKSPFEAVQTNILGIRNLILGAIDSNVGRMVFTSSDKAVNPTNVMGTSKLMGERLITAANNSYHDCPTLFLSTRFGNVLGSRGSVIPVFRDQIRNGQAITLTDPGMTRFIMSIREAVELVIDSVVLARGGEVFVTKMPVIRIPDLAEVMKQELATRYGRRPDEIRTETIGAHPGEKLFEELMTDEEKRRALELERYFVVRPAFEPYYRDSEYTYPGTVSAEVARAYNSANETPMTQDELRSFLHANDLLEGERPAENQA